MEDNKHNSVVLGTDNADGWPTQLAFYLSLQLLILAGGRYEAGDIECEHLQCTFG